MFLLLNHIRHYRLLSLTFEHLVLKTIEVEAGLSNKIKYLSPVEIIDARMTHLIPLTQTNVRIVVN